MEKLTSAPVSAANYAEAKQADNLAYYEWGPAQSIWYFIGFNFRRSALQDVELRHALSYAIPRDAIVANVFNGLAQPTYSTYSPSNWVYDANVAKYDYDIDQAKTILDNAGYKLDANGNRLDKSGNPIQLKIYFPSTDPQRQQIALIAQEEFGKLGIHVDINGLEGSALFDYLNNHPNDWDMWVGLSRDTSDPYFMYQAWSESTIPDINTGAYVNKDVENLFAQGNTPPCDQASRLQVFQRIQEDISQDSPYIFLVATKGYAFVNKRVTVNPPTPLGINYRINEWSVNQ